LSIKVPTARNFSIRVVKNKDVPKHLVLHLNERKTKPTGPGGHLKRQAAVVELRNKILPDFMAWAELKDLTKTGFRVAIDIEKAEDPVIHLMAGVGVAAQSPQDWLSPPVIWNPNAPALFFEKSAEAAKNNSENMAFENKMLYSSSNRNIFGVVDGDPKAPTHFLILAQNTFGNIMDKGFTAQDLNKFFETAYNLCQQMGILDQHIRLVANTGTGFQVGPRVHMHILSDKDRLPSMFPVDYGFELYEDGTLFKPKTQVIRMSIMNLINRRLKIEGFSAEANQLRQTIDLRLMRKLAALYRPNNN